MRYKIDYGIYKRNDMQLTKRVLVELRQIINEAPNYRSGPKLVDFFNELGFNDTYGEGFPSRWFFTDEKLGLLNGSDALVTCIKHAFAPIDFVGKFDILDSTISEFNNYLSFDGLRIIRVEKEIVLEKIEASDYLNGEAVYRENRSVDSAEDFLKSDYAEISLDGIDIDANVLAVMQYRVSELHKCIEANLPLSAIIHAGSILEGVMLGIAKKNIQMFNTASSAPKKDGSAKLLKEWSLANLIDVSSELGYTQEDVKKFSHVLRDFRNYIHPHEQVLSGFTPSEDTMKISCHVLKAALTQIKEKIKGL